MLKLQSHIVAMHTGPLPADPVGWHERAHEGAAGEQNHPVDYLGVTPYPVGAVSLMTRYLVINAGGWTFLFPAEAPEADLVEVFQSLTEQPRPFIYETIPVQALALAVLVIDPHGHAIKNRWGASVPVERGTSPATNETIPTKPITLTVNCVGLPFTVTIGDQS